MALASRLRSRFKVEFAGQLITLLSGALLIFLLARLLGPDDYGLLFLAMSVFSIVQVFTRLGLAKSGAKYISEFRERDSSQIPHILSKTLQYNFLALFVTITIFYIFHDFIANVIGEPELSPLLLFGILFIVFETLTAAARYLAQGFENIRLAASLKAINYFVRLIFATLFVVLGFETLGALTGFILGSMLACLYGLYNIYKNYYKSITAAEVIQEGLPLKILKYNIPLTMTNFSGKIDKQIDTVLVGFFLNPLAVSHYVLSKQIVSFVQAPAHALGFSTSPTYGKNKASDQSATSARIYEESLIYTLLLYIPAAIGVATVAQPMVKFIFGEEYLGSVPVLQILSVYLVLLSLTHITDYPLDYLGRARSRAIAKGIASIGNVVLNILLIPLFGVTGAAIATVLTQSFYVTIQLYIITTELPLDYSRLVSDLGSVSVVCIGMSAVVLITSSYIGSLLTLFGVISLGLLTWGVLGFLTGLLNYEKIFA